MQKIARFDRRANSKAGWLTTVDRIALVGVLGIIGTRELLTIP